MILCKILLVHGGNFMTLTMEKKDEMLMRLVHYFITEQNYSPMVVNGVKDEIWLQRQDGPYKIIRINGNYIHNKEQFNYDIVKLKNVMRQVKRKTLSWQMNALNILLDINEDVSIEEAKNIASVSIQTVKDIMNAPSLGMFEGMEDKLKMDEKGFDLIIDVTNDINQKTEKENKIYESIFKEKKIVVTTALIFINVVVFFVTCVLSNMKLTTGALVSFGALFTPLVKMGEIWRLVTTGFLHANIFHLLFNMYSLYLIGTQVENFIGKWKFLILYLISLISASLMSGVINSYTVSVGASGAIFGLLGALVYFGYQYRVYLGSILKNQIIPLIVLNLLLGFLQSGIDNAAHIGGLIGGLFAAMALGVQQKENTQDKVNGFIVLCIYILFLAYLIFTR